MATRVEWQPRRPEVRRVRAEVRKVTTGGLRAVYRTLELPGRHPLKDGHAALDAAVLAAYGFDPKKDLLPQLLELNLTVAAREKQNLPVTAPGVPPSYGDASGPGYRRLHRAVAMGKLFRGVSMANFWMVRAGEAGYLADEWQNRDGA